MISQNASSSRRHAGVIKYLQKAILLCNSFFDTWSTFYCFLLFAEYEWVSQVSEDSRITTVIYKVQQQERFIHIIKCSVLNM